MVKERIQSGNPDGDKCWVRKGVSDSSPDGFLNMPQDDFSWFIRKRIPNFIANISHFE